MDEMKVFISWATRRSHEVGAVLQQWLREVFEELARRSGVADAVRVRPWLSDVDMEAGVRVQEELRKGLAGAPVAVLCMTVENLERAWIIFEAGAIANQIVDHLRVCPYLVDAKIRSIDLPEPLRQYNYAKSDEEGTRHLLAAVNNALGPKAYAAELVEEVFAAKWPALDAALRPWRRDDVEPMTARQVADLYSKVVSEYTEVRRLLGLHRMSLSDELIPLIVEAAYAYGKGKNEAEPGGGGAEDLLADVLEKARLIISRAQDYFDVNTRLVGNVRDFLRRHFDEAMLEEVVRKKFWPVLESGPGDDVEKIIEITQRYKIVRDAVFNRFFELLADALDRFVCKDEWRESGLKSESAGG